MKTNADIRNDIIQRMVAAYRHLRKLERALRQPKMTRVFKNPKCKTAVNRDSMLNLLLACQAVKQKAILEAYQELPEVGEVRDHYEALEFAAKCAKRPRASKFMKSQKMLVS